MRKASKVHNQDMGGSLINACLLIIIMLVGLYFGFRRMKKLNDMWKTYQLRYQVDYVMGHRS